MEDAGEKGIKPKTETPKDQVMGYFTTIESILIAGLLLYADTPYNPMKTPENAKHLIPNDQLPYFRLALQHSVPITLFRSPETLYEDIKKVLKKTKALSVLEAIHHRHLVSRDKSGKVTSRFASGKTIPEWEFGKVLETPVDSKVLRNFLLNMYRRNTMNTFRSFLEMVLRDLLPECVKMSFTAKSMSDASFSAFFGVNKRVMTGGGIVNYDKIDPSLEDDIHTDQKSKGLTTLHSHRRISYENFFARKEAPKSARGLDITYYSSTERFSAVTTATDAQRSSTIPEKDLLLYRIFPMYISGASYKPFIKDSYRIKAISNSLPVKLIVLDNKDAAETRRQAAQDHSVDFIHRRFYKMNFTLKDIITITPFVHRFYVPPSVFGFGTHAEEEFGFAGIYVTNSVKYKITTSLQGIETDIVATYELARIQSLIDPSTLAKVAEVEADKKSDADQAKKKAAEVRRARELAATAKARATKTEGKFAGGKL